MRLWHKDLIPVLPRQQLLGQWRECCAIMANIAKKGTPNHVLVNKVLDYPLSHFYWYSANVTTELSMRGYNLNYDRFCENYVLFTGSDHWPDLVEPSDQFPDWHNDRYLIQCYYNLQEKYDCGAITEDEWQLIDERYKELIGEKDGH